VLALSLRFEIVRREVDFGLVFHIPPKRPWKESSLPLLNFPFPSYLKKAYEDLERAASSYNSTKIIM
jgi:hypothetical protein